MRSEIQPYISGGNAVVLFAYGLSGSGKTYTVRFCFMYLILTLTSLFTRWVVESIKQFWWLIEQPYLHPLLNISWMATSCLKSSDNEKHFLFMLGRFLAPMLPIPPMHGLNMQNHTHYGYVLSNCRKIECQQQLSANSRDWKKKKKK